MMRSCTSTTSFNHEAESGSRCRERFVRTLFACNLVLSPQLEKVRSMPRRLRIPRCESAAGAASAIPGAQHCHRGLCRCCTQRLGEEESGACTAYLSDQGVSGKPHRGSQLLLVATKQFLRPSVNFTYREALGQRVEKAKRSKSDQ